MVRAWKWRKGLRQLAAGLPGRDFDVIVPFTFWPSLAACLMRERLGASRMFWNHRGGYDGAGVPYSAFLVQRVLAKRPVFLANSVAGARFLSDTFRLPPADVKIIPNAYVPDQPLAAEPSAPVRSRTNELSLIQVANFYPEKDYDTLLEALRILKTGGAVCRLHFCGEFLSDAERSRFLARTRELGVEDKVEYHGPTPRERVLDLLSTSDIGLLSSRSEGQPNSVMEYMYAGLPVVGTRIAGIQELVGAGNEEWLFDVGDAEGLARLIGRLAADPLLRTDIGRRNRRRIVEHFAPEQVLPQWSDLVEAETP
jgi:glycosyltransferase involved in cell wall biosynthesis